MKWLLILSCALLLGSCGRVAGPQTAASPGPPQQPPEIPPAQLSAHEWHEGPITFDPPKEGASISAEAALDAAWAEFPTKAKSEQALLALFTDQITDESRLIFLVRYEGACIGVSDENEPQDANGCSLLNHQFNVLVDAKTGEVFRAYTDS